VNNLATSLDLPHDTLDRSDASLDAIDRAVRRIRPSRCMKDPNLFTLLVAYVGEVIRSVAGGRWEMRLAEMDATTWEPWVIDGRNREFDPWWIVYKELHEWDRSGSLHGAVNTLLLVRAPPQPPPKLKPTGGMLLGPVRPDIIDLVPTLVNNLATSLDLPHDTLDRSDASLDAIDRALARERARVPPRPMKNVMEGLTSYLGEVLCQKTGGEWRMLPKEGWNGPVPAVVDPHGRVFWPVDLYLMRLSATRPLRVVVENALKEGLQ